VLGLTDAIILISFAGGANGLVLAKNERAGEHCGQATDNAGGERAPLRLLWCRLARQTTRSACIFAMALWS
jgi:hypothetical protein